MLKIQRLNMDSSWKIQWKDTTLLIDPWLINSQIDYFKWFSEQWHIIEPVNIEDLEDYDAVLVSQPYTDHCHTETLSSLRKTDVLAIPSAATIIQNTIPDSKVTFLPRLEDDEWQKFQDLNISYLKPAKLLAAQFYGLVIKNKNEVIVYCPHGFELTNKQISILKQYEVKLLFCNFSSFKLPFFLGGYVNPGKQNALDLIKQLKPQKVVHTHDENKEAKGLVKQLAKVKFADYNEIGKELGEQFLFIDELGKSFMV